MKVDNDDVKDEFFIKKIVDPSWNLIKNEYRVVRVMLYSIILIFFTMDMLAIIYYY